MAKMDNYAHGHFCWVDLASHSIEKAKAFYSSLLEWEAVDQDTGGGPPYCLFKKGGIQTAGLGELSAEMQSAGVPPMWNSYINVDDVNETVAKAESLGATVAMPVMQVLDAGWMAAIQDPSGGHVMLWQKNQHAGAGLVNEPGTWVWNELMTGDPEKAVSFFQDLFGWTFEKDDASPQSYWTFSNGDRLNGGLMQLTDEMQGVPPHWAVYFSVADIKAAVEQIKNLGGQIFVEPFEVSVGHVCVAADDQGAAFQLIQLTVPPDE